MTIESPSAIAQQVLSHLFYGLDLKEIETYRDQVERVTPADIQRVARQFLKPEQLSIVLVGDANVFAEQLKGMGFADFERIPIGELDLNAPSLRRGGTPPISRENPPPR